MPEQNPQGFSVEVGGFRVDRISIHADNLTIRIYQHDGHATIQAIEITCSREEDGALITQVEEWRNPENRISVRTRIDSLPNRRDGHGHTNGNGQSHEGGDS